MMAKVVLLASMAILLWFYVWRPIALNWPAEGDFWQKLVVALQDFKTKAVARLSAILAVIAPTLANALGMIDLPTLLADKPWLLVVVGIPVFMAIDFLRSFGKSSDA